MNEHWNIEVVRVEHGRNVFQMHLNLVLRCFIMVGLDFDLDGASIWKKRKVMGRCFVGESHCMIASVIHVGGVVTGFLMLIVHGAFRGCLGLCPCGHV